MRHVPVHGTLLRCVDGSNIGVQEEEEEDFLFHLFYRLYIKTAALNLVIINAHESIPYLMMICHDISRPISYEKVRYLYPTQRVAEGIMFLTRPSVSKSVSQSVSQSVSPVFLVSATPLKPLNRIS